MASTSLSRTPGSTGNRKTWTWSAWVKPSNTATDQGLWYAEPDATGYTSIKFASNKMRVLTVISGSTANGFDKQTTRLFRDTSAWYHLVVAYDSTQATADDRVKIYVNGVLETSFDINTFGGGQNLDSWINTTNLHQIGVEDNISYFNGSMTHVHFIDGTQYQASDFGETDSTTGIWKPKTAPSVTYGTNGFFLKFENSGAFGTDSSGNSNTFTVNGTMTQTIDTPSNVFATLNAVDYAGGATYSLGNTRVLIGNTALRSCRSTLGMGAGKYYCEVKLTAQSGSLNRWRVGITNRGSRDEAEVSGFNLGVGLYEYAWNVDNGAILNNNSDVATYSTCTTNDICSLALDLDNNKLYFAKNGTWQNSADPSAGTGGLSITDVTSVNEDGAYFFAVGKNDGTFNYTLDCNFGNGYFGTTAVSSAQNPDDGIGIFEYDVPTGYRALCTKSINAEEYS